MKQIIAIGKPTHFRYGNGQIACGLVSSGASGIYDGRNVDCLRCRRTQAWKNYMGHNKVKVKNKEHEPKDTNFYSTDPAKMQMYGHILQAEKEIERLNKKVHKLCEAGDVMYKLLDPPSISMRTTEYDNALQGWDDAKIKLW